VKSAPLASDPLPEVVDYYLEVRHRLGFALQREGAQLTGLAAYAQEHGHSGPLTTELMVRWAQSSAQASPRQQARRLAIARRLAQFWAAFAPATQVPPPGLLGSSGSVRRAYIYSPEQIRDLLAAAGRLPGPPAWRGLIFKMLLGLLACTGMRVSEALQLQRQDLDRAQARLHLRHTKGGQSRYLILHPSTLQALEAYDRQHPGAGPQSPWFSLKPEHPLAYASLAEVFDQLRHRLGWPAGGPRLHDLRHTFAVNCVQRWYDQGANLDQKILALSTYLGHANPQHTYWYLSATPQLLTRIQARRQSLLPLHP